MTIEPKMRGLYAALLGDEKPWSWDWKYNPNLKEHMHALGVIAANYNELEGRFYRLFYLTFDRPEIGKVVFAKLNNAERMDIALKIAEQEPLAFRDHYTDFISAYGTATENRNILMHSKAHNAGLFDLESIGIPQIEVSQLTLAKPSKKSMDENNFVSLSLEELRSVADDMAAFSMFGWSLFYWRVAFESGGTIIWKDGSTATPSLPERLAAPRRLVLSPQEAPKGSPPQREPSGE